MSALAELSPLRSITILRSESLAFKEGQTFPSIHEFDAAVHETGSDAPADGSFNEVKFRIDWANGRTYTGGLYLRHFTCEEYYAGLVEHIREHVKTIMCPAYRAKLESKRAFDAKSFDVKVSWAKAALVEIQITAAVERISGLERRLAEAAK